MTQLVLSELRQICTKFDRPNFWHTDSQNDRNVWGTLIVHLTQFVSALPCICL